MSKLLPFIFFMGLTHLSNAQAFKYPSINKSGKTISDFIPKGWELKDSVMGDLNADKTKDMAFIIQFKDTVSEDRGDSYLLNGSNPRILLIAFKNQTGYTIEVQHNTFILRNGEGGMDPEPYEKPKIKKGVLWINSQFLRGSLSYKFRYQNNAFSLIGATYSDSDASSKIETWDYNFLSKKALHTIEPMAKGKKKEEWRTIPTSKLKTLNELVRPFTWEVFPNTFI